jgi:DNA-binding NarL/FixJ family response regulator
LKPLRILISDDYEVVRQGIRCLLRNHEGWEVCGEAVDGRDAVAKAAQLRPDVVILDIGMPNLNGLEAARQIHRQAPHTLMVVLTMDESEFVMKEALQAGVRAYVLKSDAGSDLVAAIEALQNNRSFFTPRLQEMVLDGYMNYRTAPAMAVPMGNQLTRREREVVQLLAEGKSTKEVATLLGLSVKTAETHRSNIMRKLDFHSVTQLVLYAVRNNIVQVMDPAAISELSALGQCSA